MRRKMKPNETMKIRVVFFDEQFMFINSHWFFDQNVARASVASEKPLPGRRSDERPSTEAWSSRSDGYSNDESERTAQLSPYLQMGCLSDLQ